MLADRSETDLSPNQSKPTLESWDVNSRNSKEAFPLLAVVAFPSQRSLCLRNVFIERDKRRIGIDLFYRFHTAFQTPFPPSLSPQRRVSRPIWPRSLIAPPFRCPSPLFRSLFLSAPRGRNSLTRITPWLEGRRRRRRMERRGRRKRRREEEERGEREGKKRFTKKRTCKW